MQILSFVTKEGEKALDQFGGSGVLGEAALKTGRDSIIIEKDVETFQKMRQRIEALGNVEVETEAQRIAVNVAIDALEASYDGPEHMEQFAEYQNGHGMVLSEAFHTLSDIPEHSATEELQDAFNAASQAIEEADLSKDVKKDIRSELESSGIEKEDVDGIMSIIDSRSAEAEKKSLECSSRGDRRFSSLYAMVTIKGKEKSIEEWFLNAKRTAEGKASGRGKPFDHIVCPFTGDKLPAKDAADLYRGLWITYLNSHPDLVEFASQFDDFTDSFQDPDARAKQIEAYEKDPFNKEAEFFYHNPGLMCGADVIGAYVKGDREQYVAVVKASHWYQNMVSRKKPSLASQINSAADKANEKAEQLSMFSGRTNNQAPWEK